MRRFIIVLLGIALGLFIFWLLRPVPPQHSEPVVASQPNAMPPASPPTSTAPPPEEPPAATRKPLKITSKGKVRLKPGESAVLGYWEIAPGMNGMAIVTPETTPEGHVKMTSKLLQLTDAAVSAAEADDLFFNLNDFDNYSAISPDRLQGLQKSVETTGGVDMLSMPAVVSLPGQRAMISIGTANEPTLSLGVQADPVPNEGGYDLSLELQRQELPE